MLQFGVGMPHDQLMQAFNAVNVVQQFVAELLGIMIADLGVSLESQDALEDAVGGQGLTSGITGLGWTKCSFWIQRNEVFYHTARQNFDF